MPSCETERERERERFIAMVVTIIVCLGVCHNPKPETPTDLLPEKVMDFDKTIKACKAGRASRKQGAFSVALVFYRV